MSKKRLVVLESPFAGELKENIAYAKKALKDCLIRGEAPIASHLLFTRKGILDDKNPAERALGISSGLAWHNVCDVVVVYIDRGISRGMKNAILYAQKNNIPLEYRSLNCRLSDASI